MSYATVNDVKSLFRNLAGATDPAVTDAYIQVYLDNAAAFINSRLSGLYLLPITSGANPISAKILSQIEAFKVAAIVDNILNSYSDGDKKPQWEKMANDMLDEVAPKKDSKGFQPEPNAKLYDATYLGTNIQQGTLKLSSTDSRIFVKGSDTW